MADLCQAPGCELEADFDLREEGWGELCDMHATWRWLGWTPASRPGIITRCAATSWSLNGEIQCELPAGHEESHRARPRSGVTVFFSSEAESQNGVFPKPKVARTGGARGQVE